MQSIDSETHAYRQQEPTNLQFVGPDIWVAEGRYIPFMGMSLGTRMTIVRLGNGSIWLHSPIALTAQLAETIDRLGPISALVAPNKFHHLFLKDWADAYPSASVYAPPGLRAKRPDIRFHADLGDAPPHAWDGAIDQVVFSGSRAFDEVVFHHRQSRTVVLTDLIVNLRMDTQSPVGRIVGLIDGVAFPRGSTPRLYRLSMHDRRAGRDAVEKMIGWRPDRVIISHGEWFRSDGELELRRRFAWLLGAVAAGGRRRVG